MKNERQTFESFKELVSTLEGVIESDGNIRLLAGAQSANLRCPFNENRRCSRICGNFAQTASANLAVSLLVQESVIGKEHSLENIRKALGKYIKELKASKSISEGNCKS